MKANEVTVEFLKATYLGFLSVDEAPQRIPNRPFFSEPLGRFKGKKQWHFGAGLQRNCLVVLRS